jgi:hypothetical protein
MDFKNIPINKTSALKSKYNKEILRVVRQKDKNAQGNLTDNFLKILKNDLTNFDPQDLSKSHCIKVRDSYLNNKFCFCVIMTEISVNQVELNVNIKESAFEEFSGTQRDLSSYLNMILDKMFFDYFKYE